MSVIWDVLMFVGLFLGLKIIQMIMSFSYTTYKSLSFHKSLEHAFHPPLSYRFKYGLMGDVIYFIAGILIALFASDIRALFV
ncbi:MAG: hypothetical protein DHS20C08_08410 [Rhodomicrobium sp.]|nr:MAG: hypothetical protein DHS20C08_08410 [Rhodomicrobium sp.]